MDISLMNLHRTFCSVRRMTLLNTTYERFLCCMNICQVFHDLKSFAEFCGAERATERFLAFMSVSHMSFQIALISVDLSAFTFEVVDVITNVYKVH